MTLYGVPPGPCIHLLQSALEVLQERATLDRLGAVLDHKHVDLVDPSIQTKLRPMYIDHIGRLADAKNEWGLDKDLLDGLLDYLKALGIRPRPTSELEFIRQVEVQLEMLGGVDELLNSLSNLLDQVDGGEPPGSKE